MVWRALSLVWLLCLGPVAARAGSEFVYGISVGAGGSWLDPSLADYRWDVDGHLHGLLEADACRGPWSLALRLWRGGTKQGTGIPGAEDGPDVRLTGSELVARLRFVHFAGTSLSTSLGGGRLHLGFAPDSLLLQPEGTGSPIRIDYEAIDEWSFCYGLALERRLPGTLALRLHIERMVFSLDTAHRNGGNIEERRDRFGNWMGRISLTVFFGGE